MSEVNKPAIEELLRRVEALEAEITVLRATRPYPLPYSADYHYGFQDGFKRGLANLA